jgi:hypothetical protein
MSLQINQRHIYRERRGIIKNKKLFPRSLAVIAQIHRALDP